MRCASGERARRCEYPSLTVASVAGARQLGVGKESVRRWVLQAQVDGSRRQGVTTEDLVEIKTVKAKVHRWEQDNAIESHWV